MRSAPAAFAISLVCNRVTASPTPYPAAKPPTVTIQNGTIEGVATSLPSATAAVHKFLGIPYAKSPPVRFGLPEPPEPWKDTLNASAWKPSCVQQFGYPAEKQKIEEAIFNVPQLQEDEDCLYINVYMPATAACGCGYPVMFWLYGGAYQFGSAGQPVYDGSAFAAYHDVIVVSANYRGNVFGFPNAPELEPNAQNLGFLDAFKALDWTRENIASFGGDPNKITIFGQSSGAAIVDRMILLNPENPPFRGAILQSFQSIYQTIPNDVNYDAWLNLTASLNCSDPQNNLTCVRNADVNTIRTIMDVNELPFGYTTIPYDNVTNLENPAQLKQSGHFAKVPVMTGNVANEGRLFAIGQNTTLRVEAYLAGTIPPPQVYFDDILIGEILKTLPEGSPSPVATPYDQLSELMTLLHFQCPVALWANQSAELNTKTWRYFYNASFPNYEPTLEAFGLPSLEVWHTSEIPMIFQTYPGGPVNPVTKQVGLIPTEIQPTAQEIAMGKFMQDAWVQFAKDPEAGPGWRSIRRNAATNLALIGKNNEARVDMINDLAVDSICSLFSTAFINGTGATAYGLN